MQCRQWILATLRINFGEEQETMWGQLDKKCQRYLCALPPLDVIFYRTVAIFLSFSIWAFPGLILSLFSSFLGILVRFPLINLLKEELFYCTFFRNSRLSARIVWQPCRTKKVEPSPSRDLNLARWDRMPSLYHLRYNTAAFLKSALWEQEKLHLECLTT